MKVVFFESIENPKVVAEITKESGAKVGRELYADGLGDREASTYPGMVRYNITTIVEPEISRAWKGIRGCEFRSFSLASLFWDGPVWSMTRPGQIAAPAKEAPAAPAQPLHVEVSFAGPPTSFESGIPWDADLLGTTFPTCSMRS